MTDNPIATEGLTPATPPASLVERLRYCSGKVIVGPLDWLGEAADTLAAQERTIRGQSEGYAALQQSFNEIAKQRDQLRVALEALAKKAIFLVETYVPADAVYYDDPGDAPASVRNMHLSKIAALQEQKT